MESKSDFFKIDLNLKKSREPLPKKSRKLNNEDLTFHIAFYPRSDALSLPNFFLEQEDYMEKNEEVYFH